MRPLSPFALVAAFAFAVPTLAVVEPAGAAPIPPPGPASELYLPHFEVDTTRPDGRTTLFALRNVTPHPIDVQVVVFANPDRYVHGITESIAPESTLSVNLRDLPWIPPGTDGVARGLVWIFTHGLVPALVGDFLRVDSAAGLAAGERMADYAGDFCSVVDVRFLDVGEPTAIHAVLPPLLGDPPLPREVTVSVFAEDGTLAAPPTEFSVPYGNSVLHLDAADLTDLPFGTLRFDFGLERGTVYAEHRAEGRFAAGVMGHCVLRYPGGDESAAGDSLAAPFEVETGSAGGTTTMWAVRNVGDVAVDLFVEHRASRGHGHGELLVLGPGAMHTVNVRDVPGLEPEGDGVARGWVEVWTGDGSDVLLGDFLRVDPAADLATGTRMPRNGEDFCGRSESRFLDFGTPSRLHVLLWPAPGNVDPPPARAAAYQIRGEDGSIDPGPPPPPLAGPMGETLLVRASSELTARTFGTVELDADAAGGAWTFAEHRAEGRFAVGVGSACIDP